MATTATQQNMPPSFAKVKKPKRISWTTFEKKYLPREDGWKYEWVNGVVEKTKRSMYHYQLFIAGNLLELYRQLKQAEKVTGLLICEPDTFFKDNVHRRPDLAYFSKEQEARMAYGESQIPEFIVEIISTNDQVNRLEKKMKNYRESNVRVVWKIYPELQEVHVVKGGSSKVFASDEVCSAAPVLPDFQMSVNDIFRKPPKPKVE